MTRVKTPATLRASTSTSMQNMHWWIPEQVCTVFSTFIPSFTRFIFIFLYLFIDVYFYDFLGIFGMITSGKSLSGFYLVWIEQSIKLCPFPKLTNHCLVWALNKRKYVKIYKQTFGFTRWQQTYKVKLMFPGKCACSERHKEMPIHNELWSVL